MMRILLPALVLTMMLAGSSGATDHTSAQGDAEQAVSTTLIEEEL